MNDNEPIVFEPGFYDGVPNRAYHAALGVSKSGLDCIEQSPRHYWDAYLNPDKPQRESTDAFDTGSALHTLVLEPELFDGQFVCMPDDAPRRPSSVQLNAKKPSPETIAAIEWWDKFRTATQGKTVLDADQWDDVHNMAASIRALAISSS